MWDGGSPFHSLAIETMIEKLEAMPILIEACPSFEDAWQTHVSDYGNDVLHVAAGGFARHLLDLFEKKDLTAFPAVGVVLERFLVEGSPFVRELAIVGVLESLQNTWANNQVDPETFFPYLGRESASAWKDLNRLWSGSEK